MNASINIKAAAGPRITIARAALFAFFVVASCASAAGADNVTVEPSQGWQGIQNAINNAAPGSTIVIKGGVYESARGLTIENKAVTLRGRGKVSIICTNMDDNVVWIGDAHGTHLENLHMTHRKPYASVSCLGNVVYLYGSRDVTLANCEMNGCGTVGVHAYNCDNLTVTGCYLHHNTLLAACLWESKGVTISGSRIEDNGGLIRKEGRTTVSLHGNSFARNVDYSSPEDIMRDAGAARGKTAKLTLNYQGAAGDNRFDFRDEGECQFLLKFSGDLKSEITKLNAGKGYRVLFVVEDQESIGGGCVIRGKITGIQLSGRGNN